MNDLTPITPITPKKEREQIPKERNYAQALGIEQHIYLRPQHLVQSQFYGQMQWPEKPQPVLPI
jgi:hypothetical protein